MKAIKTIVLWLLCVPVWYSAAQGWTALYAIDIAKNFGGLAGKKILIIDRVLQAPATQLLFSWNARRPSAGSFIF